jgi:Tfp pilus assembly protein PilN
MSSKVVPKNPVAKKVAAKKLPRLDLDFSPARRNRPVGWVLLAAGLAAALMAAVQFQSAQAARMALASELSSANGRLAGARGETVRSGPPLDPRVSKAANQIAKELQMPWAEMLAALEAVPTPEVALLGVEPSAQRHVVRITAEAKNSAAMLDYLQALQGGQQFSDVWLTSHLVQVQTPGTPVRFVVQLKWSGV